MRLVSVAAVAALVLVLPQVARAQAAPQEPAPATTSPAPQTTAAPQKTTAPAPGALPPARAFTANAGLIFNTVKPDREADFEQVITDLRSALEQSTDPTVQAQARGWRIYKAAEPGPNNTILYVFVIDPAVPGADYGLGHIFGQAYTDPAQLQAVWKLYTESVTGGGTLLNLGPPVPPAPATPTTPAASPAATPFAIPDTQPKMLPPDADPNRR
ncbi:MAG TPA: hypothetical protein VG871_19045 [Vicinamibacterales bacterium]|nr:hypothetical protein [Vicinamibacterales bacterium]